MLSKTPLLTALTGMDVFAHAFESYTSINSSPYSEIMALESLKLFAKSIENAVKNGTGIEAREEMALSSLYAGIAIAHTGTTLPHSLGLSLSALFNANHGGSLAACLPEIIEWTLPVCEFKIAKVAEILDPSIKNMAAPQKAQKLPGMLENLMIRIGASFSFSDYGMKEKDIPAACDYVFKKLQEDMKSYPKIASWEDLKELIEKCMY
jgi:alcohol dehydrogenase class IV